MGLIHTLLALLSMATGTIVLLGKKGTVGHKRTGYVYAAAVLGLNGTALGIYNFGGGNLFHIFAIVSLLTLLFGLTPAWRRNEGWFARHYYFMSWSVVGLLGGNRRPLFRYALLLVGGNDHHGGHGGGWGISH